MLGFYNYTVVLTYLGLVAGFGGIVCSLQGNMKLALLCLMLAGFCDMFDGKIAATRERTEQEKRFGIQIDSLSDLICFGALPALLVYTSGTASRLRFFAAALYLLCALIRLAWFNVDEEQRQKSEAGSRKVYLGLPVTSAALIFPLLLGVGSLRQWPTDRLGLIALLFTALAFLTPFRLKKPTLPGILAMLLCGSASVVLVLVG